MKMLGILGAAVLAATGARAAETTLNLAGDWRFALDRGDAGIAESWFARPLDGRARLPGSLTEQRIGDPVTLDTKWVGGIVDQSYFTDPAYEPYRRPGNIKVPFWLQPETYYAGPAWYQRDIEIPADWKGRRVVLSLERPHWETRVWVDGRCVGTNDALATPHDHDLGILPPGRHTLSLRVDNRVIIDVGENSHSISDHTQGNWNGVVGRIELRSTPPVWIDSVVLVPDFEKNQLWATVRTGNATGQGGKGRLHMRVFADGASSPAFESGTGHAWEAGDRGEAKIATPLGASRWDEFAPKLIDVEIALETEGGATATWRARTGIRDFTAKGTQFAINGRPLFLRGTLDCCIYPKTGYPPTDVAEWKRIIGVAKAHGLNLIRFHSWCPPEAAFAAADELGFFFHVEASSWANQSTTIGDGKPLDAWIYAETDRILKYYGHHPSFVLMPYGNEPGGKNHKAWLAKWVDHYKALDPRRLWTSAAGWPELPENQWHCVPGPRIQGWGEGLKSRINAKPPETTTDYRDYIARRAVPVVSHEIGQWCAYPNFDEIAKYTGPLKPRNFEIFRDTLVANHMGDQAHAFLMASGELQALCYKEEIESALRTPGMAGFELLDLHDFPGQGTALVGVLDPFWETKGYIAPAEYARFCGPVVPLARMAKRVWTADGTFKAGIEIAQFGAAPITNGIASWSLLDAAGKELASGGFTARSLPVGLVQDVGEVSVELRPLPAPARYRLVVWVGQMGGLSAAKIAENDWDLWVYPAAPPADVPADVHVARALDEAALAKLKAGGTVLLCADPKRVKGDVAIGFSSIFWNTAWTRNQAPHTLGILCDPKHPVFASFPTDFHSNWQWWELIHDSGAMVLDALPPALRPLVQPIDTWFKNRRLGLLFEAKVAGGRLMVCSMDIDRDLAKRPAARQLRASLFAYLAGPTFAPKVEVAPEQIRALMSEPRPLDAPGAKVTADSEAEGYEAARAADGDPATLWHSAWDPAPTPYPHWLQLEFAKPGAIAGLVILPRGDMNNGRIARFEVRASDDGATWGEPLATGRWTDGVARREIRFTKPVRTRFLRLVALDEVHGRAFASVAEIEPILP